jgi:hypothetical protein
VRRQEHSRNSRRSRSRPRAQRQRLEIAPVLAGVARTFPSFPTFPVVGGGVGNVGKLGNVSGRVHQRQVFFVEAAIGHASGRGPDIPRAGRIWRRQGEVGNLTIPALDG